MVLEEMDRRHITASALIVFGITQCVGREAQALQP